jgi:hypothetical protein
MPDAIAPSDAGTALRGVRVAGTRPGVVARLSGSSAAAPVAARLVANVAHAFMWAPLGGEDRLPLSKPAEGDDFKYAEYEATPAGEDTRDYRAAKLGATCWQAPVGADAARGTPTPMKDDMFRRGRYRQR